MLKSVYGWLGFKGVIVSVLRVITVLIGLYDYSLLVSVFSLFKRGLIYVFNLFSSGPDSSGAGTDTGAAVAIKDSAAALAVGGTDSFLSVCNSGEVAAIGSRSVEGAICRSSGIIARGAIGIRDLVDSQGAITLLADIQSTPSISGSRGKEVLQGLFSSASQCSLEFRSTFNSCSRPTLPAFHLLRSVPLQELMDSNLSWFIRFPHNGRSLYILQMGDTGYSFMFDSLQSSFPTCTLTSAEVEDYLQQVRDSTYIGHYTNGVVT